jgi:formamidopyrimidine-DNA glycosylase
MTRFARSIREAWSRSTLRSKPSATRSFARDHTLKRALTDPHLFSGIGNAYSDEISHTPPDWSPACPDPVAVGGRGMSACTEATQQTLRSWIERLRGERKRRLPGDRHGVSRRDGRARPLQTAMPGLRRASPADCLR